jgi:hypothetical protein
LIQFFFSETLFENQGNHSGTHQVLLDKTTSFSLNFSRNPIGQTTTHQKMQWPVINKTNFTAMNSSIVNNPNF